VVGLSAGGCSYNLGGFFGKEDKAEMTASLTRPASANAGVPPTEADLAIAKAAVHEALSRGNQDTSVPWENPRTGARGTVTPIASAYNQDGFTCREFRASYVREADESWLQGEACRIHQGKWEVKNLRPLTKRT
jgi:surface antigen